MQRCDSPALAESACFAFLLAGSVFVVGCEARSVTGCMACPLACHPRSRTAIVAALLCLPRDALATIASLQRFNCGASSRRSVFSRSRAVLARRARHLQARACRAIEPRHRGGATAASRGHVRYPERGPCSAPPRRRAPSEQRRAPTTCVQLGWLPPALPPRSSAWDAGAPAHRRSPVAVIGHCPARAPLSIAPST